MTWETVTPLQDDEPLVGRYAQTFHIGQRVRVRLSGECQAKWHGRPKTTLAKKYERGHIAEEDGRIGTVERCPDSPKFPCHNAGAVGHGYPVRVDEPFRWEGIEWGGGHYAACELEAL